MNYFDWSMLATYAGTLTMVGIITQLTKGIKLINRIPTQIWSYIVALVVMYPAHYFTGQLTVSSAFLIPFNSAVISLAANGGFSLIKSWLPSSTSKDSD